MHGEGVSVDMGQEGDRLLDTRDDVDVCLEMCKRANKVMPFYQIRHRNFFKHATALLQVQGAEQIPLYYKMAIQNDHSRLAILRSIPQ